jgi:hypothetical protein
MKYFTVFAFGLMLWVGAWATQPTPKHITTWSVVVGCAVGPKDAAPKGVTIVFSDGTIETITSGADHATKAAIIKAVGEIKGTIIHLPCALPLT